ncbi:hypothetical protein GCM10010121_090740 [Streptomyces brasiliensis]|uniref:Uncharacterized protein n=1 Tax=Streptomyces brasiliensis TaxID=1954 RepID=A0A917P7Z0_9ACTN|nr:hypothetical protein GCM10010121_090740 [Streptomyces brasiliensis]
MKPFSLSRAHMVAVPVGLSVALEVCPPPPPHADRRRARAAVTAEAVADVVVLLAMVVRFLPA